MMPFSLTNTPATCQELINNTFQDILNEYIIVYLDNILIYSNKIFKNHIIKIKEILRQFNNRRFLLKSEKCKFYQIEVKFLEYIIR